MNKKWRWLALLMVALLALLTSMAQGTAVAQQLLGHQIFVSSSGSGVIDGIAYADEDILLNLRTRGQDNWLMFFDGSAAGLPAAADIDAFELDGNFMRISLSDPVNVPGIGLVDDSDILVLDSETGQLVSRFFGSFFGLATNAEDVDALADLGAEFLISTVGKAKVLDDDGEVLIAENDDLLVANSTTGTSRLGFFRGSNNRLSKNDVTGAALSVSDLEGGTLYLTTKKAVNLSSGGKAAAGDIIACPVFDVEGRDCPFHLFFDASAAGFPKIDAIHVVPVIVD